MSFERSPTCPNAPLQHTQVRVGKSDFTCTQIKKIAMKLPNNEKAVIPQRKIVDYLLSSSHRDGHGKAKFFTQHGFSIEAWEELAQALRRHAANHEIAKMENSPFGTRYVIEGAILTPEGRSPLLRSVWFIATDETIPQFATASPLKRRAT